MIGNWLHAESAGLYRRLLTFVWPHKGVFLLAVIGMVLAAGAETSFVALLRPIMDEGFVQRDPAFINWIPILLIMVFAVRAIAGFLSTYSMNWVGRRVVFEIRRQIFNCLVYLPATYYDKNSSAALVSKLIYDVEQVASACTTALTIIIKDTFLSTALFVYMLYLDWRLTAVLLILAPLIALMVRIASRKFRTVSKRIQESVGDIAHVAKEAIQGQRIVKTYGGQEHEQHAFFRVNNRNRQQAMKKAAIAAINEPFLIFIVGSGFAAIIYFATRRAGGSGISAGVFVSYLGAMMMIMAPLKRLAKINEVIQVGLAAAQSAFSVIGEEAEQDDGKIDVGRLKGKIHYQGVSFSYPAGDGAVIKDIDISIQPGETVALVGPSGGGKSTIVNLLLRFYHLEQGRISIDGVDINDMKLQQLRTNIAMVTQETLLFDDSIRNNIVYGNYGDVSEKKLAVAVDAAHVSEITASLPDGLDTIVGEHGSRLSGGQRQRIAIARALFKDAPILLLDEATSALDSESERFVQQATQQMMQDRTTLVIAHRLSTVENADQILVIDKGCIVERGRHRELIDKKGTYARLYHTQMSNGHDDS